MKAARPVAAVLIAAFLLFLLPLTALAEEPVTPPAKGSISITQSTYMTRETYNDTEREMIAGRPVDYKLYLLFPATLAFDEKGNPTDAVAYTCTDAQKAVEGFDTYFTADSVNNVSVKDTALDPSDPEGKTLNAAAIAWIKEHIRELGTRISLIGREDPVRPWYEQTQTEGEDGQTVYHAAFHNLDFGYYYIDSLAGAAVMIDTTHPDIDIRDKSQAPGMTKTITNITGTGEEEGSRQDNIEPANPLARIPEDRRATVQIGDTVEYTLDVLIRPGGEHIILSDSQSPGLTLDPASIKVKLGEADLDEKNYRLWTAAHPNHLEVDDPYEGPEYNPYRRCKLFLYDENYHRTVLEEQLFLTEGNLRHFGNLVVLFEQDWVDTLTEDTHVKVVYNCVVNQNAFVAWDWGPQLDHSNYNRARLTFGHGSFSIDDQACVYSARLVVFKYEGEGESGSMQSCSFEEFDRARSEGKAVEQRFDPETGTYTYYKYELNEGVRPLNGVEFVLKDKNTGKYFHQDETTLAVSWVDSIEDADTLITGREYTSRPYYGHPGGDGYLILDGLTNGTYTLIETKPLPGYNKAPDTDVVINNQTNTLPELRVIASVQNKTGSLLPSTGGIGTAMFYMIGAFLAVGTGLILVTKQQKGWIR